MAVNQHFKEELETISKEFLISGSDTDFARLYHLLKPFYRAVLRKYYFKDNDNIEDVLSYTFMNIYVYRSKFNLERPFFNYAYSILLNNAYRELQHIKARNIKTTSIEELYNIKTDDEEPYMNEENQARHAIIIECIKDLRWKYRDFAVDKYINEMKNPELCEKYGYDMMTVKNINHQALYRIKRAYDEKVFHIMYSKKKRKDSRQHLREQ